jgi:hypothetical protein
MSELAPLIDVTGVRVLARYVVELEFADWVQPRSWRAHQRL